MKIVKPPIHPTIKQDESPLGYLKRLTQLNHYEGHQWLIRSDKHKTFGTKDLILAKCFMDYFWIIRDGFKPLCESGEDIRHIHLAQDIRYCPYCLKEDRYWRGAWALKVSICCSKHKVWLLDRCPGCGKTNRRSGNALLKCGCGTAFSEAEATRCSESLCTMQAFLEGEDNLRAGLMPAKNGLSLLKRIKLLEFTARRVPNYAKFRRGTNIHLNNIETAKDAAIDTANALFTGTAGYIAFLKTLKDMGCDGTTSQFDRLTLFYRGFYNICDEPCFVRYKEILEQFVNEHIDRPLTRRNNLFSEKTIRGHQWVALQQATKEYKLPKSKLLGAINSGWLEAKTERKGDRDYTLLSRPQIESRFHFINEQLTALEARLKLGVTKAQLYQLIEHRELKEAVAPEEGVFPTWRIPEHEVEQYLNELFRVKPADIGDVKPIQAILQAWGGKYPDLLVCILRGIRAGSLMYRVKPAPRSIRTIMLKESQVLALVECTNAPKAFTVPHIAKLLGINEEFTYQLINAEVLASEKGRKENTRTIYHQHIKLFQDEYVLLSKLANVMGVGSRTLITYLEAREIHPVDETERKKLRQRVYCRSELISLPFLTDFLKEGLDWAYASL